MTNHTSGNDKDCEHVNKEYKGECFTCNIIAAKSPTPEPTLQEQTILILNTLANQVEWCVGVPGSPSIDRDREVDAINDAQTALTALIEKAERKARIDELEWLQNKHKEETNDGWNEPSTPLITYVVIRKHIIKKELSLKEK